MPEGDRHRNALQILLPALFGDDNVVRRIAATVLRQRRYRPGKDAGRRDQTGAQSLHIPIPFLAGGVALGNEAAARAPKYGAPPEALGLLHYLTLINSFGSSLQKLEAMEGGAQEKRLVGGSWILSKKMAEGLQDKSRLSSPVRKIVGWDRDIVELHTDTGVVRARQLVFSASQGVASRIVFAPALPAARAAMHRAWPVTAKMRKAVHVYARPFWRDAGFNGQVLDIGGALLWSADNSPPDASVGILTCFVREGALPADPAKAGPMLAATYARALGEAALHPLQYHEIDWGSVDEWTRSCVSPYPPGFLTRWGAASREPMGRVIWSGTDMAELHPSSMDGAIRAGRKAALQALAARVRA